jgi:hypothetical protein
MVRDFDKPLLLRGLCCGTAIQVHWFPCPICKQPFCPDCGNCRCERRAKTEVQCDGRTFLFQPDELQLSSLVYVPPTDDSLDNLGLVSKSGSFRAGKVDAGHVSS